MTNEKPKLKITDDLTVEIDDRKNTVLQVEKLISESDNESIAMIDKALELFLGEKAVKKINELDLSFSTYQTIFTAVMAGAMGEDFEVVEERFRTGEENEQ